jgi:hypothetical protein
VGSSMLVIDNYHFLPIELKVSNNILAHESPQTFSANRIGATTLGGSFVVFGCHVPVCVCNNPIQMGVLGVANG